MAPGEASPADAVVWTDGDAELLVRAGQARAECREGLLVIAIPVFTDQTQDEEVLVPFAIGAPGLDAGLAMATHTRARGPEEVVDRWGEPLIAAAWDALVALCTDAVAPRLPDALWSGEATLTVAAQAGPGPSGEV